jgi:hypothetical protein
MKWMVSDTVKAQSKENLEEITWESIGKDRKIAKVSKFHECQSSKGDYEWDNSCGGECY